MTTKAQLKDQIGTDGPRPILYCPFCGGEYSANAGDYWNLPNSHVFTCCGQPVALVVRRTIFEAVQS